MIKGQYYHPADSCLAGEAGELQGSSGEFCDHLEAGGGWETSH